MESKGDHDGYDQTFTEKQDPTKDIQMEELSAINPKSRSEEKSADFMNQSFFQSNFSRNTFTLSTIKDGKLGMQMQEGKKHVMASRLVTAAVIVFVILIFSVPIIVYYALKTDAIPQLNSELEDVNISMVNLL